MNNVEYTKAKIMLLKTKNSEKWFGGDYNLNIYKGCSHGCIYCDSRSECYGIENFDKVLVKENSLELIQNELIKKRKKGIVSTGAMSDPYNPLEKELELTRETLKLFYKHNWGATIATKSALITRDIDIIEKISEYSPVCVKISITTIDDNLSKIIEPGVSVTSERFDALRQLRNKDIFAGVLLMPILPYITDKVENIREIVKKSHECGAKFIYFGAGVTLRQNQRTHYLKKLDLLFPGLKQKYLSSFGNSYFCRATNVEELYQVFKIECARYGILYKMDEIIRAYKEKQVKMTLF